MTWSFKSKIRMFMNITNSMFLFHIFCGQNIKFGSVHYWTLLEEYMYIHTYLYRDRFQVLLNKRKIPGIYTLQFDELSLENISLYIFLRSSCMYSCNKITTYDLNSNFPKKSKWLCLKCCFVEFLLVSLSIF